MNAKYRTKLPWLTQRAFALWLTLGLALARAATAQASPIFPPEIQAHLQLSYTPQCTLCHSTLLGGAGTAITPFAVSMKSAGLVAENLASLDTALDTLAANNTDSNGDGIPDIQQLKDGSDPNTGATQANAPVEKYGCGARIASGPAASNAALSVGLMLLGIALLKRRRARSGDPTLPK